ncbi:SWAHC protein, partial [Amia calva]|nr:SWAHC protein [Amia calva]
MASQCTQEAVLRYLAERGGRVSNAELIDHFKPLLPSEPASKAAAKEAFKGFVDTVGFVKPENGVKYVFLKKKYRDALRPSPGGEADGEKAFPAHASLEGEKDHALKRGNASSSWVTCTDSAAEVPASELELDRIQGVDSSTDSPAPESLPEEEDGDLGAGKGVAPMISRRRASKGSQRSLLSSHPSEEGGEDGQVDAGGDGYTPRGSRRNFRELLINSSPQLRRSVVLKNPGSVSARQRDSVRSDSDSASLMSSTDEDGGSVTLDPLEHEWMMCSSDGHWESLHRLLSCEPNLIVKKDFVTGFTCLHWAAKQGKPELIALLVNFAKHHAVPLNINCRSSAGYTPLHLAAMHNHVEVVKLLVGAYDANVDARDYSGKKAWQYLGHSVAEDIREIVGAGGDLDAENVDNVAGRWRLSKVLPANLMPLKLLNVPEEDACDAGGPVRPKSVYRKTSISRIKPKLHKIKFKTQIIHTTSFKETEEGDRPLKSPGKSRPKSTLFG